MSWPLECRVGFAGLTDTRTTLCYLGSSSGPRGRRSGQVRPAAREGPEKTRERVSGRLQRGGAAVPGPKSQDVVEVASARNTQPPRPRGGIIGLRRPISADQLTSPASRLDRGRRGSSGAGTTHMYGVRSSEFTYADNAWSNVACIGADRWEYGHPRMYILIL